MSRVSITPLIKPGGNKNKSREYSIFIRVTHNCKSRYYNTGLKIKDVHWSGKDLNWIKPSYPNSQLMNKLISKHKNRLDSIVLQRKLNDLPISSLEIVEHYKRFSGIEGFHDYVHTYVKNTNNFKSDNTRKKYVTFEKYIGEYNADLSFANLGDKVFQSFADWLVKEKKMKGISAQKMFDPFKRIVRQAVKDGYLRSNPFEYADIEFPESKPEMKTFLNVDELEAIRDLNLANYEEFGYYRDLFLFMCYTGTYYSDVKGLRWSENINDKWLIGHRMKNGRKYVVPLEEFEYMSTILTRLSSLGEDALFPIILSNSKFNLKIKEIAKMAGIKKNVKPRTGRDSFGQYWVAKGLPDNYIQRMMGQVDRRSLKNYFSLEESDLAQAISKIND